MNYKRELTENILPFWLEHGVDWNNGGIFTCLDEKGNIYGKEKSVWFQGRALWTFSKAYNLIESRPEYLKAARNIYEFLPKCTDVDGRMFFTVTETGKELQKRRYYFSETFAAIGCAEFYKATREERVLDKAVEYFDVAYECYKGIRKTEPKINPDNCDMKAVSPTMIMLSTAQTMRSTVMKNKDKYHRIAKECLDELLNGGYLKEKALLENVSRTGEFVNSPTGRIVNPGHSLEAAWFVILEGLITDDKSAILKGKEIIDITLPLGWDDSHGGIISFTDIEGYPPVALEWDMKLWWPQCEAMIALKLAYLVFKDEKYLEYYNKIENYCRKYFIDSVNGEWYGYLHYDNSISSTLKGNIFKGPFHIPRWYMIMSVLDETGSIEDYTK